MSGLLCSRSGALEAQQVTLGAWGNLNLQPLSHKSWARFFVVFKSKGKWSYTLRGTSSGFGSPNGGFPFGLPKKTTKRAGRLVAILLSASIWVNHNISPT